MEIKECAEERQALLSSTENPETQENDEDEAISLRNLPLIHDQESEELSRTTTPLEAQEDFNFCYPFQNSSQMRAADEMFFRGQILPLRHSQHNSISRSQSMDHYFSGESMPSSRSSSTISGVADPKLAPRNQFHSHPSPSPRIQRNRQQNIRNNNKKSLFRGGLIAAPPEIALDDLKSRCSGKKKMMRREKKRAKAWDIVGGCKCSVDAAEMAIIKRSASREEDNSLAMNHRTSQWLKKLSVQGAAAAER